MELQKRFNLAVGAVFVFGLLVAGYISYRTEQANAHKAILKNAELMMETALATRGYTIDEIRPLLELDEHEMFLPQTVPAYAAHQTFARLNEKFPDYTYREAVLNPTNPRDRATAWEVEVIQRFRNTPGQQIMTGERQTEDGVSLYLAHPIQITNAACLECHSTPDAAPASLLQRYGESNGFGWQMNEIVGAQIVSVPASLAALKARESVFTLFVSLFSVFLLLFVTTNVMLRQSILMPLARISEATDELSLGNLDLPEFPEDTNSEIGALEKSINRLRRSLESALNKLDGAG
jgi:HAMP domain-containing protein